MVKGIVEFILRFRMVVLILVITLTAFFAYNILKMKLIDNPNEWPPPSDPNVILNQEIEKNYGGANVVTIQLETKDGDIFNYSTLKKIKLITDDILLMDGVVPFYVTSLAAPKVKYMKGTEDFLDINFLIPDYPSTQEDIDRIKYGVLHNPTIYGSLVSLDKKASLIIADFWSSEKSHRHTTHQVIYKRIKEICEGYADDNTKISYTGTPIIIGWVNSDGLPYILFAFIGFILVACVALWFAFKNIVGIVLPIVLAITSIIWAFGLQAVLMGEVLRSASAFVVPFVLVAASCMHSVQFLKRYFDEEYPRIREARPAILKTFSVLLLPMGLSLITDIAGFGVLAIVPFDNVSVLGRIASFGLVSMLICICLLLLPLLSYFPGSPKKQITEEERGKQANLLEKLCQKIVVTQVTGTRARWMVMTCMAIILIISIVSLFWISVGQDNTYAIHNYLTKSWRNNRIFQMQMEIKERFKTIFPLNILIKTRDEDGMKSPEVLKQIDKFAEFLQKQKSIGGVMALPLYIKLMNRTMHGEKEEYFAIPKERRAVVDYLYLYDQGAPGTFQSVVDYRGYNRGVLVAFADNTSHETVNSLMNAAREYAKNTFNNGQVTAFIGAGTIGIASAFNNNILKWLILASLLSALASFVCLLVSFRSFIAGLFFLLPLAIGTIIFFLVMKLSGIEINSNITSAMAIAMGVGVDAELYFYYRFREEYVKSKDFNGALIIGFTKIRNALIYSHLPLIIGCWALIPIPLYVSYVGYGMGMILFLCFAIGFVLPPFLYSVLRPKFIIKRN